MENNIDLLDYFSDDIFPEINDNDYWDDLADRYDIYNELDNKKG